MKLKKLTMAATVDACVDDARGLCTCRQQQDWQRALCTTHHTAGQPPVALLRHVVC